MRVQVCFGEWYVDVSGESVCVCLGVASVRYVGATERSLLARQARAGRCCWRWKGAPWNEAATTAVRGLLTASNAEVVEGAVGRNGVEHFSADGGVNEGREGGGGDSGSSEGGGVEKERLQRGMIDRDRHRHRLGWW